MKNILNLLLFKALLISILVSGCKKPTIPTVSIGTITEITDVSAKVDINVTSDGNEDIVERGILIGEGNGCATCNGAKKITTSGTLGTATIVISGLKKATKYNVSAYAINKMGQFNTPEISFTTSAQKPVMNDVNMKTINITSATATVDSWGISDDGGAQPTNRGICWSTNPNPTISDNLTNDTVTSKISCCFSSTLSELKANTKYFVRGYVKNSAGISYTKELSFTTQGNFSCQPNVIETVNVRNVTNVTSNKFLLTGQFSSVSGVEHRGIVRFNDDGSIDKTFKVNISNFTPNTPWNPTILSGGKILIPGTLGSGQSLVRINENGTLDESFKTGTGANQIIIGYSVLSDGKIILIGRFSTYNGVPTNKAVRLNADGTIDASFIASPSTDFGNPTFGRALSNGKILVHNSQRTFLLNSNGSIDSTSKFNNLSVGNSIIALLKNDKLLCLNTSSNVSKISRLNSDGTVDNTFIEGSFSGTISMGLESSDNKYYIGGSFTTFNGTPALSLIRLNSDGTVDNTFNVGVGFSGLPYSLAASNDNKLLIGGGFTLFRELTARGFIKINLDGSICR
jgi:uncharacterized delta-60 repeat protein